TSPLALARAKLCGSYKGDKKIKPEHCRQYGLFFSCFALELDITSGPIPHLPSSHAYDTRRYELRSHSPGHSSSVSHFCRARMVGRGPWSLCHGPGLSRSRTRCSPRLYRCLRLHFPEVSLLYQLVVAQAARGAVQHDFAGLQHVAIVGDRKRHVRILLHHEDGGALLVDRLDDLEHLLDEGRRQTHLWFIHAQQLWPRHQGAPHPRHFLL